MESPSSSFAFLNDKLNTLLEGAEWLLPELVLIIGLFFILVADLAKKGDSPTKERLLSLYHLITLLAGSAALVIQLGGFNDFSSNTLFDGVFILNSSGLFFKLLIYASAIVCLLMKAGDASIRGSEYHLFSLSMVVGASFLVMSGNFIVLLLAIEIMSLASYALTAYSSGGFIASQALRYFLTGAIATAIMIYGISFLYGFTGEMTWHNAFFWDGLKVIPQQAVWAFFGFFLIGLIFKFGAVPFHLWVPGVYKSAPLSAVALFSTVPKLAVFAVLWHLSHFWSSLSPFNFMAAVLVAGFSILVGNFTALREGDARAMLGWSAIAQAGFIFSFLVLTPSSNALGFHYYLAVYAIAVIGAFWCLKLFGDRSGSFNMKDWRGMGSQWGMYGIWLLVFLVSLIGIPPVAGFTAKLLLFSSLADQYFVTNDPVILSLLFFGLLNTAVSAFYYLRIPYYLYFSEKGMSLESKQPPPRRIYHMVPAILALLLLLSFFKPDLLNLAGNPFNFVF
jgi:NADH-quinone oxidoreductase subunit N